MLEERGDKASSDVGGRRLGEVAMAVPHGVDASGDLPAPAALRADDARPASTWTILGLVAVTMLAAVWTFDGRVSWAVLPGFALIVGITVFSLIAHRRLKISSLVVATTVTMVLTIPWSPVADRLLALVAPINFIPLTTPVLVLAGLVLAKDAHVLRRIGWRIVPAGLAVLAATYLASAVIAHLVLSVSAGGGLAANVAAR